MHNTQTQPSRPGATDLDLLLELNLGFIRAVRNSDVEWFGRNLSQDFLNSNADGTLVDRAQFLRQTALPVTISGLVATNVQIRLMGDVAIIHGGTRHLTSAGGLRHGRYTDVWARRDGTWLAVSAHVTRQPPLLMHASASFLHMNIASDKRRYHAR